MRALNRCKQKSFCNITGCSFLRLCDGFSTKEPANDADSFYIQPTYRDSKSAVVFYNIMNAVNEVFLAVLASVNIKETRSVPPSMNSPYVFLGPIFMPFYDS